MAFGFGCDEGTEGTVELLTCLLKERLGLGFGLAEETGARGGGVGEEVKSMEGALGADEMGEGAGAGLACLGAVKGLVGLPEKDLKSVSCVCLGTGACGFGCGGSGEMTMGCKM